MLKPSLFVAVFLLLSGLVPGARAEPKWEYRLDPSFPHVPAGMQFGQGSAVATDSAGDVFVFHRAQPPVLVFHPGGDFVRSFGENLFTSPHGLRIDKDDNVWVTDNANHTITKFSHDGKVLMKLGEKDVPGEDDRHFNKPADIAFAPNGDFFIADGYGNSRVVKFDKGGKYLMAWGHKGKGEGEFNLPHAVRLDSKGNLYVADRENNRIQVFTQDGKYVRQFGGFAPYGLFITPDDRVFVADGRANRIRVMDLNGKVITSWGSPGAKPEDFNLPHGLTVAADGSVYVTEINGKRVQKFVAVR
jgi:DNA-binding beta-propeller fold protein YncE